MMTAFFLNMTIGFANEGYAFLYDAAVAETLRWAMLEGRTLPAFPERPQTYTERTAEKMGDDNALPA